MAADPPNLPGVRLQNETLTVPLDSLLDRAASELALLKQVVRLLRRCRKVEAELAEANHLVGWLQAERQRAERATWKRTGRPPRAPASTQ